MHTRVLLLALLFAAQRQRPAVQVGVNVMIALYSRLAVCGSAVCSCLCAKARSVGPSTWCMTSRTTCSDAALSMSHAACVTPAAVQAVFAYTPYDFTPTKFFHLMGHSEFRGLLLNGLPGYCGPPQQLPADLAHEAFGAFKDILRDGSRAPTHAAQRLVMKLLQLLPG
jgi:hypothetical protein